MFASTALAAFVVVLSLPHAQALTLHARQSDGGAGLTSPGAVGFDYPPIRGWSLDAGRKPICGGFDLHARTDFPSTGGPLALVQQRDGYDVQLSYSSDPNPTELSHFTPMFTNHTHLLPGTACYTAPNFDVGDDITFMLTYQTGRNNATFWQCADVKIVEASAWKAFDTYTCENVTTSTRTRGGNSTSSAVSGSSSATAISGGSGTGVLSSSSKLSAAEAGGIGAGVTICAVLLLLAALYFTKLVHFGKANPEKYMWRTDTNGSIPLKPATGTHH
ncbi:hypothetical protein QFC21_006450 [Naganishia friedmannii]|uniref:Uncharacterized protein n=1 Tax=Naganishia friedmannii TaxID=89922 RepID=A0ACC2V334_9TREE|nr:hypothetical protein QFC21_006450 [Naganishia friedmannii]